MGSFPENKFSPKLNSRSAQTEWGKKISFDYKTVNKTTNALDLKGMKLTFGNTQALNP